MAAMARPRLVIFGRRRLRYKGKKMYGWKFVASNNRVLAHDGRQDYENEDDAEDMANRLLQGQFINYDIVRDY